MRICCIFAVLVATLAGFGLSASAANARSVTYRGYRLSVPTGWPVYRLADAPRTCVRFDRHAVYLGTPNARQRCPAHAVGRTEAVLVWPGAGRAHTSAATGGVVDTGGPVDQVALGRSGLVATATWSHDRPLIARLLHHSVTRTRPRAAQPGRIRPGAAHAPIAHAAQAVYTGLGFDACAAPSTGAMSAWSASPFRAAGIYIGGVNSACAQPNLTSAWVTGEVAAGWHLIPTYVGYQGAGSCGGGCATIAPSQATAEGVAAANDAVSRAQALGITAGNPIYDDMEQYSASSANTAAVLAFLSGWTTQLHAAGYTSGVYSSASSAITDLVDQQGTGYAEPDDIWIGDWNNRQSTSDSYVPDGDWATHQRLHQYRGAHDDTYGGVTLNVDSDYLDGATADTSGSTAAAPPVVPDGTFIQESGFTDVYRVAGGAPLLVTSWDPYGGPQPVTILTAQQFSQLRRYPADGTFVQTTAELDYRFAGGAAFPVSSWAVFGGIQSYVVVDAWDIANPGTPESHVLATPVDGTVVEGLPSDDYWGFCSGQRAPVAANAKAIEVDDAGLSSFATGTNSSCVVPVRGAGALLGKVVKRCVVPKVTHLTLSKARALVRRANCRVGKVRRPRHVARHHTLRVSRQSPRPRAVHRVRYKVGIWLR